MTRFKISLCVITAILAIGILANIMLDASCDMMTSKLEEARQMVTDGKKEEAEAYLEDLGNYWDKRSKLINLFVKNDKTKDIHISISKLEPYVMAENDEADAEFACVIELVKLLKENETPFIGNIL